MTDMQPEKGKNWGGKSVYEEECEKEVSVVLERVGMEEVYEGSGPCLSKEGTVCGVSSGSAKRRKVYETDECMEDEDEDTDDVKTMRMIGEKIRAFVFKDSSKMTKSACEVVLNYMSEYEELMMRMICKNERLSGRLEECKKSDTKVRTYAGVTGTQSASNTMKKDVNVLQMTASEKDKNCVVIVRAKDNSKNVSSDDVKEKVLKEVSEGVNVRVKSLRKIRNGGIAIETASEKERKKLEECEKFKEVGLKIELPRKIGPKIIIYDVPNVMTNDELLNEMYERNLKGYVSEQVCKERMRVMYRSNKKESSVGNVIVEMSMSAKNRVVDEGRIYVKWNAFKVSSFESIPRCFKCYGYGHVMKECTVKDRICMRCCESGHIAKECKKSVVCRNCKMKGLVHNHSVMAKECPEYKRAAERMRGRISDE